MSSNENLSLEPGALVQIRSRVHGAGKIGIVIGPATHGFWAQSGGCLDVLLDEGAWQVHPTNLQKPDGRTRRRG
jgi:hypothetical protein